MKKTYLMLLLALGGFGSSCTNDDGTTDSPSGSAGEIQLVFSGSGESEEYTKAIASNSENEIKNLKVYLFASSSAEAGDDEYYYMETWSKTEATPTGNQFLLQSSGSSYKASIKPGELKGLPYLTLVCVANQDDLFKGDGNAFGGLTAVTVDANGAPQNAAAATDLADFKAAYTANLAADGIIKTPLVMTGMEKTKVSGSVSKVAITLKRVVARFDIDNTTATSRLTITHIALGQGRLNASLFGAALAEVTPPAGVMTYADVEYKGENANQGTLESALYVYPNLATDKSFLIIKGTYSSPSTGQPIDVTYNIPIVKTPEDATPTEPANYIAINANSRYKLHITDVTESNIFSTFEVEDWTSGGGVIVKPGNDAPVFDVATGFTAADGGNIADIPVAVTYAGGATSTTEFKVVDGKSFKTTLAATGKIRAEKAPATKADVAPDAWLTFDAPTYEEKDGIWYTTFVFKSTDATGKQPVNVTFINDAASYDPDLWTTLTFYGPLAAPSLKEVANGHSTGNAVDIAASTATMYKLNNSLIKVEAMCIEGVTVEVPAGFSAEAGETNGYTTVYTVKINKVSELVGNEQKITFKNKEAGDVKTELTVTLAEPGMTMEEGTDTNNAADVTDNTIKVDLDVLATGNFTFKVNAPQGLTAGSLECPWLTITESHAWADTDGNRYAEYTVAAKGGTPANFDDFDILFTNALAGAANLTVTLNKAASKPKLEAATAGTASDFNGTVSFPDASTATVDMYKANGSKVYVKMTCDEAAAFASVTGLSMTKESDDNYEVKVTDATQFTAGATTVITAKNSSDETRTATLTITWLDPAITFEKTLDTASAGTIVGDDINVNGTTFKDSYGTIKVKIKGYKGSVIAVSDVSSTWAGIANPPSVIAEDGTAEITISAATAVNADATNDITITVTNAITGGGDKTITLKKQ